ncbi:MAG: tetratricopeptide repeat protein [Leptospirales bacterium]|jgi:tetratricopeptide (TPR) repeat protein
MRSYLIQHLIIACPVLPALLFSVACATEVSEADQTRAASLNQQGLVQFQQGNLARALQNFQSASETNPREAEYPNNAGMALLQSGQAEKALMRFEQAADLNESLALYPYNQALALVRLNEDERAIAALEKAVAIKPDYFDAFAYSGLIHFKNAEFQKAADAWEKATTLRDNAELESNLGLAYMNLEKPESAEGRLKKAIELEPTSALAHYNAGVFYQRQQKLAEAEQSYLKAVANDPAKIEAYMNAAIVQTKLGDKTGAIANLEQFIQRAPPAMTAQVNDAQQRLAELRK